MEQKKEQKKRSGNPKHKLTKDQQDYVLRELAAGFSASMIVDDLERVYGVTVTRQAVNFYRTGRWKEIVKNVRKILDEKLAEHPLASKEARLDWLYRAAQEASQFRVDKVYFKKDGTRVVIKKANIGEIKGIMREARIEMEGDKEPPVVGVKLIIGRPDGAEEQHSKQ